MDLAHSGVVARVLLGLGRLSSERVPGSVQILGYGLPPVLQTLVSRHQNRRAQTTADRSLARRLREAVRQSEVEVRGIAFYIHDGVISVYGSFTDPADREALLAVMTQQPGVRRIVDHLRVEAD